MNAEQAVQGRRVKKRYSAEDRERLIQECNESGKSRKEFCSERGINLATMYGWFKALSKAKKRQGGQAKASTQLFAEVEVRSSAAPIEVRLPNGKMLGIHLNGNQQDLIELIRGVLAC